MRTHESKCGHKICIFGINVTPHITKVWLHKRIRTISTICCKKFESMMGTIKEKLLTSSSIAQKFVGKKIISLKVIPKNNIKI